MSSNNTCCICIINFENSKELKKHLKSEGHWAEKVKKGIYNYGCCPYCRVHLYYLQLPDHISTEHKEHFDKWKHINVMTDPDKIKEINKMLIEYIEPNKELTEPVKEPDKTDKKYIKRRGKYRHMTEEQIKNHKKELCKERMRRFYEKNRDKYKIINATNYEKKPKKNTKRGRPPIYTN